MTKNDDGLYTLAGICARGGGDTFTLDGEVVNIRILRGDDPTVTVDGEALDLSQFREDSGDESGNETDPVPDEPTGRLSEAEVQALIEDSVRTDEEIRTIVREQLDKAVSEVRESIR